MKATAIFFSPAGGTKKAIRCLKEKLEKQNMEVQLLDITGDKDIFLGNSYEKLFAKVEPHDLLIVGGPVYIDHLHYNVADMLKALPPAEGKWSDKACLVAVFGKVTPGVALAEMSNLLQKTGRKSLAALSIDGEHCISRVFTERISANLPGEEIEAICQQAADDLARLVKSPTPDADLNLCLQQQYADFPELDDEKLVMTKSFPEPAIDYEKCGNCLLCVKNCPVCCIQEKNKKPIIENTAKCIHCANCLVACPKGAILMDISYKEDLLRKKLAVQGLTPTSPSRSQYYSCQS